MANGGTVNMMESTVYFGNYALKQQQTVTGNTTTTTLERETLRIMDGETCLLIMHYWKLDDKKEKQNRRPLIPMAALYQTGFCSG
jgi:hypothetical protein